MSVISEFISGLPSFDEKNFSRFHADSHSNKAFSKRPSVYLTTKDHPSEQVIVTEKTNILLRYLHQQKDKKNSHKKRDLTIDSADEGSSRKIPRVDNSP